MSDEPDPAALLRAGRLAEARAALVQRVKGAPGDIPARLELVDTLILLGEWEKADTHADLVSTQDPGRGVQVALIRQLIRAAAWRDDVFERGRPPELVTEPDGAVAAALSRIAGTSVEMAEVPPLSGTVDGRPFAELRDLDDRTAGVLEVLTSTGKYCWVPFARVAALKPAKPERLRDLVWRPAELDVAGGPSGVVYLPVPYHAPPGEADEAHRLARKTDWIEAPDGSVRGLGARCLLIDDDVLGLDGFAELAVAPA